MLRILFVCVENAGRSQMAEAFAKRWAPAGLEVYSAGSRPAASVHPIVAQVLREVGLEIGRNRPKGLDAFPEGTFDVVVGMGCGDACPVARTRRFIQWEIPDPKDQPLEAVRRIRDEVEANVRELLKELPAGNHKTG